MWSLWKCICGLGVIKFEREREIKYLGLDQPVLHLSFQFFYFKTHKEHNTLCIPEITKENHNHSCLLLRDFKPKMQNLQSISDPINGYEEPDKRFWFENLKPFMLNHFTPCQSYITSLWWTHVLVSLIRAQSKRVKSQVVKRLG